jgi:hypothetical protein
MRKNILKILIKKLFLLSFVFYSSGCATLNSKSVYPIIIHTQQNNLVINIFDKKESNIILTNIPDTVYLEAGRGYFRRERYAMKIYHNDSLIRIIPINFVLDRKYLHNVFFINLFGLFIIDPITGAMWKPERDYFYIE